MQDEQLFEQAWETALDGRVSEWPCREHGHYDCATTEGGECMSERADREYGRLLDRKAEAEAEAASSGRGPGG